MKKIILNSSILVLLSSSILLAGANAGVEQEVESGQKVTLNGSESTVDNDGRFVRVKWKQRNSEERVSLLNKRSFLSSFIAPTVQEATTLTFRLTTKERFKCHRRKGCVSKSRDLVNVIVYPKEAVAPIEAPVVNDEIINHESFSYHSITSPITNRVWLDRDLGATSVSSSGSEYQWGRESDGHQLIDTRVEVFADATKLFGNENILYRDYLEDWLFQNSIDNSGKTRTEFWSRTDGSSICPVGYRVPTIGELENEMNENRDNLLSFSENSPYWSATSFGGGAHAEAFNLKDNLIADDYERYNPYLVRCIKD